MNNVQKANVWIYNQSVRCAEKNSLSFELSKFELMKITELPCMYCGEKPRKFRVSGVDRLNSSLGFTKNNTVPACSHCIRAKGSCDISTFIKRCLHISKMNGGIGILFKDCWSSVKFKKYEVYKSENMHKDFQLSAEEYYELRNGICVYCRRMTTKNHFNGIDRIDCDAGYLKENCETCCIDCNLMKLISSKERFINHVKKIAEHLLSNIPPC